MAREKRDLVHELEKLLAEMKQIEHPPEEGWETEEEENQYDKTLMKYETKLDNLIGKIREEGERILYPE